MDIFCKDFPRSPPSLFSTLLHIIGMHTCILQYIANTFINDIKKQIRVQLSSFEDVFLVFTLHFRYS